MDRQTAWPRARAPGPEFGGLRGLACLFGCSIVSVLTVLIDVECTYSAVGWRLFDVLFSWTPSSDSPVHSGDTKREVGHTASPAVNTFSAL